MNRALAAAAAPLLLLGALTACGSSGQKAIDVTYAKPPSEAECQAATVRLLQGIPLPADPAMDAVTVHERVGYGALECIAFDDATIDRIYAQAVPEFLANPGSATRAAATPAPAATPDADPTPADTPTPTPEDRTEQCRAAIRKIVQAGIAAENAGGNREAAEDRATAEVEKDKPCKGVSRKALRTMYAAAERELGGR